MTFQEARRFAHSKGYTLRKRDGEYRLADGDATMSPSEREERAYYSDDLDDVIATINFKEQARC